MEHIEFDSCKKKDVRVTLKFPPTSDSKAESEFIGRLKEIYLRKIEARVMQSGESALNYYLTDKSVSLSNTKEDVSYE